MNLELALSDGVLLGWIAGFVLSAFCLIQGLVKGTAGSAMTRKRSPFWFCGSMCLFAATLMVTAYQSFVQFHAPGQ